MARHIKQKKVWRGGGWVASEYNTDGYQVQQNGLIAKNHLFVGYGMMGYVTQNNPITDSGYYFAYPYSGGADN